MGSSVVGFLVGSTLGDCEGLSFVGCCEGYFVGSTLGLVDGVREGESDVGEVDGLVDGLVVGSVVIGELLGKNVGETLGLSDVGYLDGASVGATVGTVDGNSDGVLVGVAVSWQTIATGSYNDKESSPRRVLDVKELRV